MLSALFVLMYQALLRVSEVTHSDDNDHNLKARHVILKNDEIRITFYTYKHSKPTPKVMAISQRQRHCPVSLYTKYCGIRPGKKSLAFCHSDKKHLTADYLRSMISKVITDLHLSPTVYNTHSFRIGKATDMHRDGYTDSQIMMAGRWSSSTYKKYIKPHIIRF